MRLTSFKTANRPPPKLVSFKHATKIKPTSSASRTPAKSPAPAPSSGVEREEEPVWTDPKTGFQWKLKRGEWKRLRTSKGKKRRATGTEEGNQFWKQRRRNPISRREEQVRKRARRAIRRTSGRFDTEEEERAGRSSDEPERGAYTDDECDHSSAPECSEETDTEQAGRGDPDQPDDIGMLDFGIGEYLGTSIQSDTEEIKDTRPVLASMIQNCKLCDDKINLEEAVIKLKGIGWVHHKCCLEKLEEGKHFKLDRSRQKGRTVFRGNISDCVKEKSDACGSEEPMPEEPWSDNPAPAPLSGAELEARWSNLLNEWGEIRGVRPYAAKHEHPCGLECGEEVQVGQAIIKLQKRGWVHARCCRAAIEEGRTIRIVHEVNANEEARSSSSSFTRSGARMPRQEEKAEETVTAPAPSPGVEHEDQAESSD